MTRVIDADALQDKMHDECCGECESCKKYIWNGERSLCGLIEEAPTVPLPDFKAGYRQAVLDGKTNFSRPKGKWIKITKDGTIPVEYICSVCGRKIFDNYEHQIPQSEFYPYCHCGADMRGDKE